MSHHVENTAALCNILYNTSCITCIALIHTLYDVLHMQHFYNIKHMQRLAYATLMGRLVYGSQLLGQLG